MINKSKVLKDAQKLVAKSQWDKAITEYEKIVAESPNDANTFNTIGDLCLKRNDNNKAIESFKKAAEIFNRTGFTLKAIALYKKVLNIKPDQVDIFILMGKLNAERGMLGNANESYLAAASYFSRQGQKVKAIDIYKTLCDLNPDNFSLAQKLTELYLSEGFEKEWINKSIELAEKKLEQDDSAGARDFLAKVEKKASERFEFIRVSALLDMKDNRLREATSKLEAANKIDPNDVRVLTPLAEAYLRSGRYEESAAIYRNLQEKDPGNKNYRLQLIAIEIKTGDFASAWNEYRALSDLHISKSEFAQAEKFLREFLSHKKDSAEAMNLLADVLEKQDRQEEAEAMRREAKAHPSDNPAPAAPAPLAEDVPDNKPPDEEIPLVSAPVETTPPDEEILEENPVSVEEAEEETAAEEESAVDNSFESEKIASDFDSRQPSKAVHETIPAPIEEEEISPEVPLPDLPEEFGDIPQAEPDEELAEFPQELGAKNFPEENELDGIDIFAVDKGLDEISTADEAGIQSDPGDGIPDIGEVPVLPGKSFEERLSEVDMLLRYGMTEKVTDALNALSEIRLQDPELKKRYLELYKSQGDVDSFIDASIELAGIYNSMGMNKLADEVLEKARRLDPGNPLLSESVTDISAMSAGVQELDSIPEITELPELALPPDNSDIIETPITEDEEYPAEKVSFTGIDEHPVSIDFDEFDAHSMEPGSVHYLEERAEADFYAQQGLTQEAIGIYERLISINPSDSEIREKLETLIKALPPVEPAQDTEEYIAIPETKAEPEQVGNEPEQETEPETELLPDKPEYSEPELYVENGEEIPAVVSEEDAAFGSLDSELAEAFQDWNEPSPDTAVPDAASAPDMNPDAAAGQPSAKIPDPEDFSKVTPVFKVQDKTEDEDFFDLGAELREELDEETDAKSTPEKPDGVFEDKLLVDVFQEFKKGVEEQLNNEDYETHYNLGIAYKEMGMTDEALGEFELASHDPARTLDCASMIGLCHVERGEYDSAIKFFKDGLNVAGHERDEYLGLKYDLATAYELKGDISTAQSISREISSENGGFRDIKERLQRLNRALMESGAATQPAGKKKTEDKAPKKSKVSYL